MSVAAGEGVDIRDYVLYLYYMSKYMQYQVV
jgi:hypothetical protein